MRALMNTIGPVQNVLWRNIGLTLLLALLSGYLQHKGNGEAAMVALGMIGTLWLHSGRSREKPEDSGPAMLIPITCLAQLALGCDNHGYSFHWPYEGARPGQVAKLKAEYDAQAGLLVDIAEFRVIATPTCTSGRACIYADNSNNLLYTQDANNLVLKLHAAQHFRTSANCAGLSSPVNGDVCYDTTIPGFRFYSAGWTTGTIDDSLVVHKAGVETITGIKTFSAAPVFGAGLTASGAIANDFSGGTGTFLTSTGANTHLGYTTIAKAAQASGVGTQLTITGAADTSQTASTEKIDLNVNMARTVQWATGALATQRFALFQAPTMAFVGASTATNSATVAITGPPIAGTNATLTNVYALWIQSGYLNAAGNIVTPSIGTSTAAQHAFPTGTGDLCSIDAAQTLTNKSIVATQLTGQVAIANGGTGAATTSQNSAFIGPTSGSGAPSFRAIVGGDVATVCAPSLVSGGGTGAIGAATRYLTGPGQVPSATEIYLSMVTRTLTSRNLNCRVGTAPGGADTVVVTVRENAVDQALTCTITGAGTTCSDTSNTFGSVAGDRLSVKAVSSAATAADITCSFEETH